MKSIAIRLGEPLSPTQRALLAAQLRHPHSPAMNMALHVRFAGDVDAERLAAAFESVVAASNVLRMQIDPDHPTSARVVAAAPAPTGIEMVKLADIDLWATAVASAPLNLAECCYRSVIGRHDDGSLSWVINIHHIATDATASRLVVERTIEAYLGTAPPKSDYFAWVKQAAVERPGNVSHWDERTPADPVGALYGSIDRSNVSSATFDVTPSSAVRAAIDERFRAEYRMLSIDLAWTALLVATTAIYISRLTGASSVAIGVPVHHRNDEKSRELIGPTMSVYPVDVRIERGDTHLALHRRVARSLFTTLRNAHRGLVVADDCDAVVNVILQTAPEGTAELPVTGAWIPNGTIDPGHILRVHATGYRATLSGSQTLASAPLPHLRLDVRNVALAGSEPGSAGGDFGRVLQAMVQGPDELIGFAPMIADDASIRIAAAEVGSEFADEPELLATRLKRQLHGNPNVVVESGTESLTGDELWSWITALALELNRTQPAKCRIGVELEPGIAALVAIFGTLASGRSFTPLDPTQPELRRQALTARAEVTRIFRSAAEIEALRPDPTAPAPAIEETFIAAIEPSDEAYLLFTSGSTGLPKGVPITHRGLARYVQFALENYFKAQRPPVAPLFTALTFDLTITTLFAPILRGGRLVMFAQTGAAVLPEMARRTDLTWCKATPSHLELLLPQLPADSAMATLVVGGEAFSADLAKRLLAFKPELAIFNEYGPTEAVVGCMIHRVDPNTVGSQLAVSIGGPAPGVTLRVVDRFGQRQPIGASGELWISHPGVTAGYLDEGPKEAGGDPTPAEATPFITVDCERFYRSGDLVVRTPDMRLTYLGRIDEQIKVGGARLDPVEVEHALAQHPLIERAAVRMWSPESALPRLHCVRCGLPDNVPDATFDADQVCNTCHAFDAVAPLAQTYFKVESDLVEIIAARAGAARYDCMHLLSGGKDSTYALYRLVELGLKPYAFTLDNGFISEEAKDNCRRVAADLGVPHEFATSPHMKAIFRDSLATHSDVCHGCYKTIYSLATNRAVELGIPSIVTGLSRGQLFQTRLIPGQFHSDRFDPDAIDRAVLEARKRYHRAHDVPNRLLDTKIFESDDLFDRVHYIDFYRYVDVPLTDVLAYLDERTPWRRPRDSGRSTNCLVNVAGIRTHQIERGYHNYAEPYAWDVRLGHKQRDESMAELQDAIEPEEVDSMLAEIGYEPKPRRVLTAWVQLDRTTTQAPSPTELRSFLANRLAKYAVPTAFVIVDELVVNKNGKLDVARLPAPTMRHRVSVGAQLEARSDLESVIIERWENALALEPIGPTDDFFALGGDSLAALTMIVDLSLVLGVALAEELAFAHTTPRELAHAITEIAPQSNDVAAHEHGAILPNSDPARLGAVPPPLSPGERSLLFERKSRPHSRVYNVGRTFTVGGAVDVERFRHALYQAVDRHEPLVWSFANERDYLGTDGAVDFRVGETGASKSEAMRLIESVQAEPFDLERGPLLRCVVLPRGVATIVAVFIHHVSGDQESLDRLWIDIDRGYRGLTLDDLPFSYSDFWQWQEKAWDVDKTFWAQRSFAPAPTFSKVGLTGEPDGYLTISATASPAELRAARGHSSVIKAVTAALAAVWPYIDGEQTGVALVASTRTHPDAAGLFGYTLNPLPITVSASGATTLAEFSAATASATGQALAHRSYPFGRILSDARSDGRVLPSASILVSYFDDPVAELAGAPVSQEILFNGHAVAEASFFVEPKADSINLGLEYNGATVGARLAAMLLDRFNDALTKVLRNPSSRVDDVQTSGVPSIVTSPPVRDHELFLTKMAHNAAHLGDQTAVVVADRELSWRELSARAAQVAHALSGQGIGRGDRVVVRMSRSTSLAPVIVGVMMSGASYVPLDPTHPQARAQRSAELINAVLEIGDGGLGPIANRRIVVNEEGFDGTPWARPDEQTSFAGAPPTGDDEAYVIFTSGSTGIPNPVGISHQQLALSTNARNEVYEQPPLRFAMVSSIAFDSSIVGIFWTLATGGTLVLPDEATARDIPALAGYVSEQPLSHLLCVPTLYTLLLEYRTGSSWPDHCIVAGEQCPHALVARHFAAAGTGALTNEYGPTEATVWATMHHFRATDESVVIGTPVAGAWIAIVDPAGQVVPEGITGELVVGGPTVVSRYLNDARPDRFGTANDVKGLPPTVEGNLFRTGDRAMILDGTVSFVGRVDNQLNVAGVRVEPEEIEAVLQQHPLVRNAVVVAIEVRAVDELLRIATTEVAAEAMARASQTHDPHLSLKQELSEAVGPDLRLVAHVEADDALDLIELREHTAARLPAKSQPSIYGVHRALPRTPNGKLDRRAAAYLALPDASSGPSSERGQKKNEGLISRLTALFSTILRVPDVRADTSFFDLGGDSLRALELIQLIEDELDVRLEAAALHNSPTPAQLAARIETLSGRANDVQDDKTIVVKLQSEGSKAPIFALHAIGNRGSRWAELSELLGRDQPFYCVADPRAVLNATAELLADTALDIRATARLYVKDIERIAPEGEVVLIGLCLGGVLAYEVAQQLTARGRKVEHVITLADWHAPQADYRETFRDRVRVLTALRSTTLVPHAIAVLKRGSYRPYLRRTLERAKLRATLKLGRELSPQLQQRKIIEQTIHNIHAYRYQPYAGRFSVIRAADDPRFTEEAGSIGWGDLVPQLEVAWLPGNMNQLLHTPYVQAVASTIQAWLGECDVLTTVQLKRRSSRAFTTTPSR